MSDRLRTLVQIAAAHDRECDEEGEGECCYTAWRRVLIEADAGVMCVTDEERAEIEIALRGER